MKRIHAGILVVILFLFHHTALAGHQVSLCGIVNVPGQQLAFLEIDKATWTVHTGDHFKDKDARGNAFQVEVLVADLTNEIVRIRIEGEEITASLSPAHRVVGARSWMHLQGADFKTVLNLYSILRDRVILLHPEVSRDPFSCEASWTNLVPAKTEIAAGLTTAFRDRQTTVIEDGDSFLQIVPDAMASKTSASANSLPHETKFSGMMSLENISANEVAELCGRLLGRHRKVTEAVPGTIFWFHPTQPLSQAETVYALETLLAWNGTKIVLNNDHTFSTTMARTP